NHAGETVSYSGLQFFLGYSSSLNTATFQGLTVSGSGATTTSYFVQNNSASYTGASTCSDGAGHTMYLMNTASSVVATIANDTSTSEYASTKSATFNVVTGSAN